MKKYQWLIALGALSVGCASNNGVNSGKASEVKHIPYTMLKWDKESSASRCPMSQKSWSRSNNRQVLSLANACVKAGQWKVLNAMGEHLSIQMPTDPWGPYYMSVAAEGEDQLDRALWLIDLALRKSSGMSILHYHKARIEWKAGSPAASIATAKQALKLDPQFTEANLFIAKLYHQDQDYKAALSHYKTILKYRGDHSEALIGAGECAYQLKDRSSALTYFQKAVDTAPLNWNLRLKLAELYETEKKYNEALIQYRRAKELSDRRRAPASQQLQDLPLKIKELEREVAKAEKSKASKSSPATKGDA